MKKIAEKFKDLNFEGKMQHKERVSEMKNRGHKSTVQESLDLGGSKTGRLGESERKEDRQNQLRNGWNLRKRLRDEVNYGRIG